MKQIRRPALVPLPPEVEAARRLARVPLRLIAATSGHSIGYVSEALRGRRRASLRLVVALQRLGVVERAEAAARELLDAIGAKP